MKREREGVFVLKFRNYNGFKNKVYVTGSCLPTLSVDDAKWFETRTQAYRFALECKIDKECYIEELN